MSKTCFCGVNRILTVKYKVLMQLLIYHFLEIHCKSFVVTTRRTSRDGFRMCWLRNVSSASGTRYFYDLFSFFMQNSLKDHSCHLLTGWTGWLYKIYTGTMIFLLFFCIFFGFYFQYHF